MSADAPARFASPVRALHWAMAVLLLAMLFMGAIIGSTSGPERAALLGVHKTVGVLILALAAIRLLLRRLSPTPPLPADEPALMAFAARAVHVVFYGLMIALPLIGWAMLSAGGYPIEVFGGVHLPPIVPADRGLHALLRVAHATAAYGLYALITLHVGAALFHGLVKRDGVLDAMRPW